MHHLLQGKSVDPPTPSHAKRRRRSRKKVSPEKPDSPDESSGTEDSSSDSSSSSSKSSLEKKPSVKVELPPLPPRDEPCETLAQLEYVKEGAYALQAGPSLESLLKYPSAWKQPRMDIVATRDLHLHPTKAQSCCSSSR